MPEPCDDHSYFSHSVPPHALVTIANLYCNSDTKDQELFCNGTVYMFLGVLENLMIIPDLNHDYQTNAQ